MGFAHIAAMSRVEIETKRSVAETDTKTLDLRDRDFKKCV